jgi:hypothetical protein
MKHSIFYNVIIYKSKGMDDSNSFRIPLAIILILYGVIKIVIGTFAVFSKGKVRQTVRNTKVLQYAVSDDETLAGKAFDIALMVFGMYTILHGLHLLHAIPGHIGEFILSRNVVLTLHMVIGFCLLVFYSLVIYTDVNIAKQKSHINRYKIEGIVSGLMFLIVVPILLAYYIVQDHGIIGAWQHSPFLLSLYVVIAIGILIITIYTFLKAFMAENKEKKASSTEQH